MKVNVKNANNFKYKIVVYLHPQITGVALLF